MFGKLMSISDQLMVRYYDLLSALTVDGILQLKENLTTGKLHPMEAKKRLAEEIVDRYHGSGVGSQERKRFEELFSKRSIQTDELPVVQVQPDENDRINLIQVILGQNFAKSKSEVRRLLEQRAIKINGEVITEEWFSLKSGLGLSQDYTLKVGKLHWIKLRRVDPSS
jgi:tyrosyl-tRNA synthetase